MKTKLNLFALTILTLTPILLGIYSIKNIPLTNTEAENNKIPHSFKLDDSNTPTGVTGNVQEDRKDFNRTHRYTDFHYKQVTKIGNEHITLANYGDGGYIQNSSRLIYDYTIDFSITANSWAGVEVLTSNTYSTNLRQDYDTKETYILASYLGSLTRTITLSLTEPYFSIWKYSGAEVQLNRLTISYSC